MAARGHWLVSTFSIEQGFGRIKDTETGAEAVFGLEAWVPCDPKTGRNIQDSDARRDSLLPVAGELVDVEWKTARSGKEVPARVHRRAAMKPMPAMPFKAWLAALGKHVGQVGDWSEGDWQAILESDAGEIDDTVTSPEPATPPLHMGALAWIREHGPADVVARRLSWLAIEPTDGAHRIEAETASGAVFVALPDATFERLVAEDLVVPSSVA